MNKSLYIIGNGFDLAHGFETQYQLFYQYIVENDAPFLRKIEDFCSCLSYGEELLWNEFEQNISSYDSSYVLEERVESGLKDLESYYEDDDESKKSLAKSIVENYNVEKIVEILQSHFNNWVEGIDTSFSSEKLNIKNNSLFLTFNYTKTLEEIYEVKKENICYIHNRVGDGANLIFGHCWDKKKVMHNRSTPSTDDIVEDEVNSKFISKLLKNCDNIIYNHFEFFKSLKNTSQIYILGHSLSKVDMPYFKEIIGSIDKTKVKWTISFHSDNDKKKINKFKKDNGLEDVTLIKLLELG